MRRSITAVWASIWILGAWAGGACSARNDSTDVSSGTGSGSTTATGTSTSTTTNGGCAAHYVYLCPSFNTGNCKASYLSIDQSCTPLRDPMPGTCYDTGFKVAGGQS